eukprot:scaffold1057_cov459-Prasinococcus_capsulatus_cf.AAC.5
MVGRMDGWMTPPPPLPPLPLLLLLLMMAGTTPHATPQSWRPLCARDVARAEDARRRSARQGDQRLRVWPVPADRVAAPYRAGPHVLVHLSAFHTELVPPRWPPVWRRGRVHPLAPLQAAEQRHCVLQWEAATPRKALWRAPVRVPPLATSLAPGSHTACDAFRRQPLVCGQVLKHCRLLFSFLVAEAAEKASKAGNAGGGKGGVAARTGDTQNRMAAAQAERASVANPLFAGQESGGGSKESCEGCKGGQGAGEASQVARLGCVG